MCGAACKKLTFRVQFVEIDGALPSAGERALRSLEGVLVEPGVRLDDSEFGVAVPTRSGSGSPIIQCDSGRCRDPSSHRRGNCWSIEG